MDLLPDHGDRINDLRAKLHTAFLSNRYPGQWQIAQDLCLQVKQILLKEQLLNTSEPGCSRHKMMNAMNAYVKRYELISMQSFNALAFQIHHHHLKDPDKRSVIWPGS